MKMYKTILEGHPGKFDCEVNTSVNAGWSVVKFSTCYGGDEYVGFTAFMEKEVEEDAE